MVLYLPEITRTGHANPERHETHLRGLEELEDGKVEGAIVIGGRQPEGVQLAKLKNLPIPVVLVSFGYTIEKASTLGADAIFDHYHELPDLVARIMLR